MEQLILGIDEAEGLLKTAKHPRNRQILETHISQLKEELATLKLSRSQDSAPPVTESEAPVSIKTSEAPEIRWTPIAESDEDDFVEIDIGKKICEGIGEHKSKVHCDFKKNSFVFSITDFGGKNFKLTLNNLNGEIVPEKSKVVVGRHKCTIKLCKTKGEYGWNSPWSTLFAKPGQKDTKKDPAASLQNMMQDMYDSGDDKTRALIGKAMEEARKKQLNPGYESKKLTPLEE